LTGGTVRYAGKSYSGEINAKTCPAFVTGQGSLFVQPKGTMIMFPKECRGDKPRCHGMVAGDEAVGTAAPHDAKAPIVGYMPCAESQFMVE